MHRCTIQSDKITSKVCGDTYEGEMLQNAYTCRLSHIKTVTGNQPPPKIGEREKPKPTLQHHVDEVNMYDEERQRFIMEVLRVKKQPKISF